MPIYYKDLPLVKSEDVEELAKALSDRTLAALKYRAENEAGQSPAEFETSKAMYEKARSQVQGITPSVETTESVPSTLSSKNQWGDYKHGDTVFVRNYPQPGKLFIDPKTGQHEVLFAGRAGRKVAVDPGSLRPFTGNKK